jgi:protein-disulfide isomerase
VIKYIVGFALLAIASFGTGLYMISSGYEFDVDIKGVQQDVVKSGAEDKANVENKTMPEEQADEKGEQSFDMDKMTKERFVGDENAPVTIYNMSSFTCGHCSRFHLTTLKDVEKKYADTGKVKIVYSDFPLGMRAAAATMLSRCVPESKYFSFVDILFENQRSWAYATDAKKILGNYALMAGLSREKTEECLANQELLNAIMARRQELIKKYEVEATPTFVITNGKKTEKIRGAVGAVVFESAIEKLLK